jgi:hypothetical protein
VFKTSCGSYAKINSVLNTGTLYTDRSVVDGASYCYAKTSLILRIIRAHKEKPAYET